MKKKKLRSWHYLITFVSALIVVILVYILKKVTPFGGHSLLTIDFFHQYGPMLGELYDRVRNHLNLIYSFNTGFGLPFYRNFLNYLSSPFNILMFLFKHRGLLTSYSVIIGLKAVLSAVTMNFYLNKKFEKKYPFIYLSILYAFSAYFVAYYWNIMWIDGMYMIPLVTLGIERLVDDKKYLLYVISLSAMIFINYFIGYMVCIFSALYFMMYLILSGKKESIKIYLKKCLLFFVCSCLVGGICAFFLIPLYTSLKSISATGDMWPTSQYYAFTIKSFLFNHFSGVKSIVLKSDLVVTPPNISCGILSIGLMLLFFSSKKISLKTKICYGVFLIILFLSFIIAPIDYIWHGMHVPNDLPYRYSFIYSFLLIVISAYAIKDIKEEGLLKVSIIYFICLVLVTLIYILKIDSINDKMLLLNYGVITVFYILYIFYKKFAKCEKVAFVIGLVTVMAECVLVINNNWFIDQDMDGFYYDYDQTEDALRFIRDNEEDKFFRLERVNNLTLNDPSWYGYYGQMSFSSMEYEYMAKLNHWLGIPGNEINSYYYKDNTPVYNMLFDIKYLFGNIDNRRYEMIYTGEDANTYKSNDTIGLMYGVNNEIIEYKNSFDDPLLNQNNIVEKMSGVPNVLEKIGGIKSTIVYENNDSNKIIVKYMVPNIYDDVYFYIKNYGTDFLYLDDTAYYLRNDYDYIYDLDNIQTYGAIDYGERYIIRYNTDSDYIEFYIGYSGYIDDDFCLYRLNQDNFDEAYNYLNSKKVDIVEFKERYIKTKTNFTNNQLVYTSIPYDMGWNVYVDGKKINTIKVMDALLAFWVEEGEHVVEVKYQIPYFLSSILISIFSVALLVESIIFKRDKTTLHKK